MFAPLLRYLPQSALAVIIIIAVSKLFDYKELKSIWHAWRSEAILAIVTVIGVTLLGVLQGLLLAVLLAMANLIRKSAFPNDAVLGMAKDGSLRDSGRPPKTHPIPGIIIYRFDAPLYFANANYFKERVLRLIDESETPVTWFLWDAETITSIDSTAGLMLLGLIRELKRRNIIFAVARLKGPIRSVVHHTHRLNRALQQSPHYPSLGDALDVFESEKKSAGFALANPAHDGTTKS
jgi:SulP family sulfate permease